MESPAWLEHVARHRRPAVLPEADALLASEQGQSPHSEAESCSPLAEPLMSLEHFDLVAQVS